MDASGGLVGGDAEGTEARRDAVVEWLGQLDPGSDDWEQELSPVAMTVVDALLHADAETLHEIGDPMRDALVDLFEDQGHAREVRGFLLGMLNATRLALERLPDPTELELVRDSHAALMLEALEANSPQSSADLRQRLHTSESQLSRVGRNLLAHALVTQRRLGRVALWELTPRGRQLLRRGSERRDRTTG